MPYEVRKSLKVVCQTYLYLAEAGQKLPSKKQHRLMAVLSRLHGDMSETGNKILIITMSKLDLSIELIQLTNRVNSPYIMLK